MDVLIKCSINCKKRAIYACDCTDKKVFLCSKHAGPHGVSNGNHRYTEMMKPIDPQTKIIISNILKDIKAKAKRDRMKIIKESSLLIMQINEATGKTLEKLLHIEKKANEYLTLCETLEEINNLNSENFIESLLKYSVEDATKIKFEDDITK